MYILYLLSTTVYVFLVFLVNFIVFNGSDLEIAIGNVSEFGFNYQHKVVGEGYSHGADQSL